MKKVHLIIGALLLSACTYNVYAEDFRLADSVRMEQSDAAKKARINEHRSAWQIKALEKLTTSKVDAKEDFFVFVEGKQLSPKDRNLGREFLKELDKNRVKEMLLLDEKEQGASFVIAKSRLDLASYVQECSELSDVYEEATVEKCLIEFFLDGDRERSLKNIDEEINKAKSLKKNTEKIEDLKRALFSPSEPKDFKLAVDISERALDFRFRSEALVPMYSIFDYKSKNGYDAFHPDKFNGQDSPIIALSHACFYIWDTKETAKLKEYMNKHSEIGGSTRANVLYNIGLVFFANKNYEYAINSFEEGSTCGAMTEYGGLSLYMQAVTLQQSGEAFDAAVLLHYGKGIYTYDQQMMTNMEKTLDFIIRQNLLDRDEVANASKKKKQASQLAMSN